MNDSSGALKTRRSGEELSAFFVGLLYFIVQWVWQMQNSKRGAGIPLAYALMVAVAVSGSCSNHVRLIYGYFPELRMRMANVFLFVPFAAIALGSYPSAKALAIVEQPILATSLWFADAYMIAIAGVMLGLVPHLSAFAISKFSADAPPSPR